MLNLEWFRTFKAIYDTGTLSAAGQVLFISQPGVSLHLNSLEAYTGYRLFEREARKMVPTDRGTMLYNFLNDPLNKLERAEEVFSKNSRFEKPTVSIGMCFEMFVHTLERYVPDLSFNLIVRFGEYPQMIKDLDTGALDLIVTSQKGTQVTLNYQPFTKEKIILVCGSETDTSEWDALVEEGNNIKMGSWLKDQLWYTTAADMEHLNKFWVLNFGSMPDFKPNFIMPYFSSIIRCLNSGKGFCVIPDFLCQKELTSGSLKLAWAGQLELENTLHFGKRIKTIYPEEIEKLEELISSNFD